MFARDEVPGWLAINWYSLVIATVVLDEAVAVLRHTKTGDPTVEFGSWAITAWQLLQALWLRQQVGRSLPVLLLVVSSGFDVLTYVLGVSLQSTFPHTVDVLSILCFVASLTAFVWAAFAFRSDFESYSVQAGYARRLSGWMTLFFSTYYFQYHLHVLADDLASRHRLSRAEA